MPRDRQDNDSANLLDMLYFSREAIKHLGGLNEEQLYSHQTVLRAVERTVELVGEAASRVSTNFRHQHPHIPWRIIISTRNIIVHEYQDV